MKLNLSSFTFARQRLKPPLSVWGGLENKLVIFYLGPFSLDRLFSGKLNFSFRSKPDLSPSQVQVQLHKMKKDFILCWQKCLAQYRKYWLISNLNVWHRSDKGKRTSFFVYIFLTIQVNWLWKKKNEKKFDTIETVVGLSTL